MSVVDAVERELERLKNESADAAVALVLAEALDDPGNSATSKSLCAKALGETMQRLRAQAPKEKHNRLDDLSARRAKRRRRSSA